MRTRVLWVGLAMVLVSGCKKSAPTPSVESPVSVAQPVATPPQSAVAAPVAPATVTTATTHGTATYGWKQYDQESFATAPSEGRVFDLPAHATRLRVTLRAMQPVFAGVMSLEQLQTLKGAARAEHFLSLPCGIVGRSEGAFECALDAGAEEKFVLRDVRERGMVLKGALLPGENRMTVSLAVYACVTNCKAAAR